MSVETDDLMKKLLNCLKRLEDCETESDLWYAAWINSLEELSQIEYAFEANEINRLHGKTILDVGTDCVKPLYISLKFEPDKIIGINENLYSFASSLEQKCKHITKTKIHLYNCSFFDEEMRSKILTKEKQTNFDFVLVSKTLHHLRNGECVAKERDEKHEHRKDEKSCIYKFEGQVFEDLLELGKRVVVYEYFDPNEEDDDKVRGRGGYFTTEELKEIFTYLSENYRVEFIEPLRCHLDKNGLEKMVAKLRQVDCVCFYVEAK